jgi:hypothetical protein
MTLKDFKEGDRVRMISGHHKGKTGKRYWIHYHTNALVKFDGESTRTLVALSDECELAPAKEASPCEERVGGGQGGGSGSSGTKPSPTAAEWEAGAVGIPLPAKPKRGKK